MKIDAGGLQTHEIYDVAGRLTDVWLPAVDDAKPANDPTLVRPHCTTRTTPAATS